MTRHDEWTGRCLHPLDDDGPCWRHKFTGDSVWPDRLPAPDPAQRHFIQWTTYGEFSRYNDPVSYCRFVRSDGVEVSAVPLVGTPTRPDPDRTPDPRSTVQMPATSGRIGS